MKSGVVILFFILFLSINSVDSETKYYDEQIIEHFRKYRIKELNLIFEQQIFDKDLKYLYWGMINVLEKREEKAIYTLNKVINSKKSTSKNKIIAQYIIDIVQINKGYTKYLKKQYIHYSDAMKKRDYKNALKLISKLVKYDPINTEYRLAYSQCAVIAGNPFVAVEQAKIGIDLRSHNKETYLETVSTLGKAYVYLHKFNSFIPEIITLPEFDLEMERTSITLRINQLLKAKEEFQKILCDDEASYELKIFSQKMISFIINEIHSQEKRKKQNLDETMKKFQQQQGIIK